MADRGHRSRPASAMTATPKKAGLPGLAGPAGVLGLFSRRRILTGTRSWGHERILAAAAVRYAALAPAEAKKKMITQAMAWVVAVSVPLSNRYAVTASSAPDRM